jgi:poly(ADP-ribose) glycohydrolase ARH3
MTPEQLSRVRGSLLGLAVGDAVGARFEGWATADVLRAYRTPQALVDRVPLGALHDPDDAATPIERAAAELEAQSDPLPHLLYTDDTQMAIGVVEALLEETLPDEHTYARSFVANYQAWRGYGAGTRVTIDCLDSGMKPVDAATIMFSDGSYGNGAAMRVAPIGVRFANEPDVITAQARESALATHRHPLGIDGAVLLAHGVAFAIRTAGEPFDRSAFFDLLDPLASTDAFKSKLRAAREANSPETRLALGNTIRAQESVPTALACFASDPDHFVAAVGGAILLGGDTDTIAAMTGAMAGARLGEAAIPSVWLDALEDGETGRRFLLTLGTRLAEISGEKA